MAIIDLTYFRQLQDYATALETYIIAATGLPADRVVFSAPDVAKRKLKEKLAILYLQSGDKTGEIDNFVSFYFPFGAPGSAEYRQSPMSMVMGQLATVSRAIGWPDYIDLHIEIDVWAGPDQRGKEFLFNVRMALNNYTFRVRRIRVPFRDLVAKDPSHPTQPYDVNCWYEFQRDETTDHSELEQLFNQGVMLRTSVELTWFITFYRIDPSSIGMANSILRIIGMFASGMSAEELAAAEYVTEWIASTSSTTSTLSTSSTSSTLSSTSSLSSSSSSSSTTTL